jgi:hypothetical protein
VQGQYWPVRANVSCAAVRCGVLHSRRDRPRSSIRAVSESWCRHFIGGRGCKASTGLYVQTSPVQARPVPAFTCRRLLCGGAMWGARAKHASRHGCGRAFGLYLNRDAGNLWGAWVQGQYSRVRANVSCAAVRCWMLHSRRDRPRSSTRAVSESWCRHFIGGVGARPVPAFTCRRLLCGGAMWGAPLAT